MTVDKQWKMAKALQAQMEKLNKLITEFNNIGGRTALGVKAGGKTNGRYPHQFEHVTVKVTVTLAEDDGKESDGNHVKPF